jgi:hypothetical protein
MIAGRKHLASPFEQGMFASSIGALALFVRKKVVSEACFYQAAGRAVMQGAGDGLIQLSHQIEAPTASILKVGIAQDPPHDDQMTFVVKTGPAVALPKTRQ